VHNAPVPNNPTRSSRWFADRLPRPDVLASVLKDDPVERLLTTARDRAIVRGGDDLMPKKSADEDEVAAMLETATKAAQRIALDPDEQLSDAEKTALDLFILLLARPALLVQKGTVAERPENWPEVRREEELLPRVIAGVGRIELADHTKIGTGFIAGEKCILTNNHVVCSLFGLHPMSWKQSRQKFEKEMEEHNDAWAGDAGTRPWFELRGELGSTATSATRITKVLGSHKDVDMAVLELAAIPKDGRRIELATKEPKKFKDLHIYAVGYPVKDLGNPRAPLPILRRVFGQDESLGMKRFSPGTILGWENDHQFHHDASTLAGSSGSCIVDFDDHHVVGLHFSGFYGEENNAVPLWKFRKDALLTKNGVVFD
jgi:endonuclease G